jgi:hypothetical protein
MAHLEARFQRSRSHTPYSHNRVDSREIAGTGEQFRPPQPQTSWPRHVEIAPEDLEPQHSAAGGRSRAGPQSSPHPTLSHHYSEADVALFVNQGNRDRVGTARSGTYLRLFRSVLRMS